MLSPIICHLISNSIMNKFEPIRWNCRTFDILLISKSKLDNTFSINQFSIRGYKVFRRNGNPFGCGLILYMNKNIPRKPLTSHSVLSDPELMTFELHQRQHKWRLSEIYKPPFQNDIEFLFRISSVMEYYLRTYENLLTIGNLTYLLRIVI